VAMRTSAGGRLAAGPNHLMVPTGAPRAGARIETSGNSSGSRGTPDT
jgi:hypothetical protein